MKKSTLTLAALLFLSAPLAQAASNELQSIRIFQTETQFLKAADDLNVVLDLHRAVPLVKNQAIGVGREFGKKMYAFDKNGNRTTLNIECAMKVNTNARKPKLAATLGSPNKWLLTNVKKITYLENEESAQHWTFKKPIGGGKTLEMSVVCGAWEQIGEYKVGIKFTPSMMDKALEELGGRVKTNATIESRYESTNVNDEGLSYTGTKVSSSPTAQ